jgi:hypothetical protein
MKKSEAESKVIWLNLGKPIGCIGYSHHYITKLSPRNRLRKLSSMRCSYLIQKELMAMFDNLIIAFIFFFHETSTPSSPITREEYFMIRLGLELMALELLLLEDKRRREANV